MRGAFKGTFVLDDTCGGRRRTDTPGGSPLNFTNVGGKATATPEFALPTGARRQLSSLWQPARTHLPCALAQPRLPRTGAGLGFGETPSPSAFAPLLRFSLKTAVTRARRA